MKTILLIYASLTFFGYTIYLWRKFGILRSISASIDYIKFKPLFTFFIWSVGLPLTIVAMETKPNALGFFAGALICFVGAAPLVKWSKMEEIVHVFGATGGIMLGIIYMSTFGTVWAIIASLYILFVIYCELTNKFRKYKPEYIFKNEFYILLDRFKTFWSKQTHIKNSTWWVESIAFMLLILLFVFN